MPKFQYKFTKAQKRAYAKKNIKKTKMYRDWELDNAFKAGIRAAKKKAASVYRRKGYI